MSNASALSGMSSGSLLLDGGVSREERQQSGDGGGWGRLSGVGTPGGYNSCSEAPTPHSFDADRALSASLLREGAAAAGGDVGEAGDKTGKKSLAWRQSPCLGQYDNNENT